MATRPRNFHADFLAPAVKYLSKANAQKVALALDCAIAFGALEAQQGNESLKLSATLENAYWERVNRLQTLVGQ